MTHSIGKLSFEINYQHCYEITTSPAIPPDKYTRSGELYFWWSIKIAALLLRSVVSQVAIRSLNTDAVTNVIRG